MFFFDIINKHSLQNTINWKKLERARVQWYFVTFLFWYHLSWQIQSMVRRPEIRVRTALFMLTGVIQKCKHSADNPIDEYFTKRFSHVTKSVCGKVRGEQGLEEMAKHESSERVNNRLRVQETKVLSRMVLKEVHGLTVTKGSATIGFRLKSRVFRNSSIHFLDYRFRKRRRVIPRWNQKQTDCSVKHRNIGASSASDSHGDLVRSTL